jgi:hypothetical protein
VSLQNAFSKYGEKVDFVWVYISEAHAIDDSRPSKTVKIKEHTTLEERTKVAQDAATALELKIPLLIDDMENTIAEAYSAHPDRLFVLDADGKIAYAGGRGPWGFKVGEMTAALDDLLK